MTRLLGTQTPEGVVLGTVQPSACADEAVVAMASAPPYPGISILPPAMVPPPPLLPEGLDDDAVAQVCASAYTNAVEVRYRRRWFLFRGGAKRSKYRAILTAGGRELARQEIRPVAWAAWSVDVWVDFAGRAAARPPAPDWVFSLTRIAERGGWFREEGVAYLGGRTVYSENHLELLRRWEAMRSDILRGMEAAAAAEKHFPDGLYDVLFAKAESDAQERNARFKAMVESGGWPW